MNYKYLSFLLIFMMGCAGSLAESLKSVSDRYEAVVIEDGIDLQEAKAIAQKQMVKENLVELYDLSNPQVEKDVAELPRYQDYWFIYFDEKRPSGIPFIFMVIIHKETGKVKFADDYDRGKQWILEAGLLR